MMNELMVFTILEASLFMLFAFSIFSAFYYFKHDKVEKTLMLICAAFCVFFMTIIAAYCFVR